MFHPAKGAVADVDADGDVAQLAQTRPSLTASSSMMSMLQTRRTSWPSTAA